MVTSRGVHARHFKNRAIGLSFATLVATALSILALYHALRSIHDPLYLWPGTAIQLALLLPRWRRVRARVAAQVAGGLGVFLGASLSGIPLWFSATMATVSLVDVYVVGRILSPTIAGFEDLKQRSNLFRLLAGCAAGPALTAILCALPVARFVHTPPLLVAIGAFLSDSLGLSVLLPLFLYLGTGRFRTWKSLSPHLGRIAIAGLLYAAVVVALFSQSGFPLLFLAFPPMVFVLVTTGLEGAVFVSVFTTVIGFWATAHDFGPIALVLTQSQDQRFFLLQIFLWMIAATALPVGAIWDDRQRAEVKVRDAHAIYQTLLDHSDDMIVLSSLDGKQSYVSHACERLTGWTSAEFLNLDPMKLIHPEDVRMVQLFFESLSGGKMHHRLRYRIAQKAGGWRWVEVSATGFLDSSTGVVAGFVGTVRDISEIQSTEHQRDVLAREREQFRHLSHTDPLTGLANRRAFDDALHRQVLASLNSGQQAALLLVDIDYFKRYNDTYGHAAGDEALRTVADTLRSRLSRGADFVGRWGGEEFVVLLSATGPQGAQKVANDLLRAIRERRIEHKGCPRGQLTVSIGIAPLDLNTSSDSRAWIQQADRALYECKRLGKDLARIATADIKAGQAKPHDIDPPEAATP